MQAIILVSVRIVWSPVSWWWSLTSLSVFCEIRLLVAGFWDNRWLLLVAVYLDIFHLDCHLELKNLLFTDLVQLFYFFEWHWPLLTVRILLRWKRGRQDMVVVTRWLGVYRWLGCNHLLRFEGRIMFEYDWVTWRDDVKDLSSTI